MIRWPFIASMFKEDSKPAVLLSSGAVVLEGWSPVALSWMPAITFLAYAIALLVAIASIYYAVRDDSKLGLVLGILAVLLFLAVGTAAVFEPAFIRGDGVPR